MLRQRRCLGRTHHSVRVLGRSDQQDVPVLVQRYLQRIQIRYQDLEPQHATTLIYLCQEDLPIKHGGQQQEQQEKQQVQYLLFLQQLMVLQWQLLQKQLLLLLWQKCMYIQQLMLSQK